MEFSLDMTLLLLAMGLSGYLVAHLLCSPVKPLGWVACLEKGIDSQPPNEISVRPAVHPRMLWVRRKKPPEEQGSFSDDADPLSFLYRKDICNDTRRNSECIPLFNLSLICWPRC
ncbi:hypothetical protein [Brevibacillus borstelensis]|uniref:hypothetical protein n=1 Tax=Brevibacillus borstelensis TaxID=45462 RepID=UPI00204213A9|nr:hypothetical protein [Brevibacillus borstelensis]MCM3471785.1 hypothetical protein [Brevibacillus borstelensis]